jgi:hypothetical protein
MKCEHVEFNGLQEATHCDREAEVRCGIAGQGDLEDFTGPDLDGEVEQFVCRTHAEQRTRELVDRWFIWSTAQIDGIVAELRDGRPSEDRRALLIARHRAIVEEANTFLTRLGVDRSPVTQT